MRIVTISLIVSLLSGCAGSLLSRQDVARLEDAELCARMYYTSQYGISMAGRSVEILREEFAKRFLRDGLQPGYCKVLAMQRASRDQQI